jgi:hypothetical protein
MKLLFAVCILGAVPVTALAQEASEVTEQYGDWAVRQVASGTYMATTSNSAGSVFGTSCSQQSCIALLNPRISCQVGNSYPALVNSPGGSAPVILLCEDLGDLIVYSFDLDDRVAESMAVGGILGIAFPMQSGEFRVERFSLTGAARATGRASQLAQGLVPNDRQNASDSLTL